MTQNSNSQKCFTIGYGDYPIELFLYFLQKTGIDTIIDVRSSPYSKFNPYFNRDNLENSLKRNNVGYRYMGDQIGGRYSNPNLLFPDGTVNYQKVRNTEIFQDGINQLISIISSGKKIALMCAEKEPERCHRFVLISRVLQSKGVNVIHVLPEIKLKANEDLEKELMDSEIDTKQINISDVPVNSVDLMYEKLNKKIAYKVKDYRTPADEVIPDNPVIQVTHDQNRIKCDDNQSMNFVSEPGFPLSPSIDILPRSDSFSDKHLKKGVQQKLF